jgi:preprotein translocase subunit SecD
MSKNVGTRTWSIIAVLVIFVYGIFYGMDIPHSGPIKSFKNGNIHLGLDLQGGTHLVLQVHVKEAVNSATDRDAQRLNEALATNGATATKLDLTRPEVITVMGGAPDKQSEITSVLNGTEYSTKYDLASIPNGYTLTMNNATIQQIEELTLNTSIDTIRERIDALGTLDPTIEKYGLGQDEILLELPGIDDPVRVQQIIETTPKLEVHEVVGAYQDEQAATAALNGIVPPDEEIVSGSSVGGSGGAWVVKRAAVIEGTDFKGAQPSTDQNQRPDITFSLTTDAGERFYKYTNANKGTGSMAILLDNKVLEVAGIQGAIRDSGEITGGGFTQESAAALAKKLSSGSIPATISTVETRTVGPSLGASSIHHGVVAAIAGMLAVILFMLVYYKGAGVNADLALILNLVILLGFMGFTGATLTLPGIAGVILTIGMGVDSNVLIFERIREERRLGKTAVASIQDGFAHAWITIVDTHITTIVSASILFFFGTGPVKGFAVTLVFGLLANLFTAVFVSRTIFDWLLSRQGRDAALSI